MATRIMVVDDEPAIGKLLTYQLTSCGYQVSYIQDGLLALHKFLVDRPDLVVLDVMMPLISGWELCRQIRACSTVPVIMLTAKSADPDVVTGLQSGADDYVTKPFSMLQLQARIEAVLRRASPAPARQGAERASARSAALPAAPDQEMPSSAPDRARGVPPAPAVGSVRIGSYTRNLRETRGLTLLQIARECNVRWEFLQAIEQENWEYVPSAELRRAIRLYGGYLGVDLFALANRKKPQPGARAFSTLPFAAVMAVLVVLVVVGMYLL